MVNTSHSNMSVNKNISISSCKFVGVYYNIDYNNNKMVDYSVNILLFLLFSNEKIFHFYPLFSVILSINIHMSHRQLPACSRARRYVVPTFGKNQNESSNP